MPLVAAGVTNDFVGHLPAHLPATYAKCLIHHT